MAAIPLKYGVISTDEHVQEAPDLWTSRLSKAKFGEDIPHIVEQPDGTEKWLIGGQITSQPPHELAIVTAASEPSRDPQRWEEVPRSTYLPSERLKAMDRDQVDTHTFFPNISGLTNNKFQREGSEEFRLACIRAYNDWLVEEWLSVSPRFIAQCISPMWDVNLAAEEIARALKNGHKGVIWHGAPDVLGLPPFNDPHWDPVYRLCSELGVPMCLHQGGGMPRLANPPGIGPNTKGAVGATKSISLNMQLIINILFSDVLDRFPKLKLITVESGIGWIPYVLELSDHEYERLRVHEDGPQSKPSDAFRAHIWANFWFEHIGIANRYHIGVENIIYETDFPHPTTTWPNSKRLREQALAGVPPEEQQLMLMENAIKLYQLDVDRSDLPSEGPP
jgi:predicted TIM-barrel fold metal-dependent hydrolase